MVTIGLEKICATPLPKLQGKRLGLLCNPASVGNNLTHARFMINNTYPAQLTALFSPQHGFFAEKQDNMIESDHMIDPVLQIPVFSLYGETRWPTPEMMKNIDVLLIDLQDVGTRVYTFMYTVSYCMEAARDANVNVIVLDRPNPIGGDKIEGNVLDVTFKSFVGRYPICMRHGLTIGELAVLFNEKFGIGCDLKVIQMDGWKRDMYWPETGLIWVPPSPNLPTFLSAMVYPGQVLWEGTNVSEGRGTTLPFEMFGAPYLDGAFLISKVDGPFHPGCILRPVIFEPTSGKWADESCGGIQIHVTDPKQYEPFKMSLRFLKNIREHWPHDFKWKQPPYEYELERLPIDMIMGTDIVRVNLEAGSCARSLCTGFVDEMAQYQEMIRPFYLY